MGLTGATTDGSTPEATGGLEPATGGPELAGGGPESAGGVCGSSPAVGRAGTGREGARLGLWVRDAAGVSLGVGSGVGTRLASDGATCRPRNTLIGH